MPLRAAGPSLKDIQKLCDEAGLDSHGTKKDLSDRLEKHKEENSCDGYLLNRSMIAATEDETKQNAKNAFEQTLNHEAIEVRAERGNIYVGNLRGLNMGEELRTIKEKIAGQDAKIAQQGATITEQGTKITEQGAEIALLNRDVSTLKLAAQDYIRVRNRFISTFKRDKAKEFNQLDLNIIDSSNVSAHHGDARVDARLFEGIGSRNDRWAFQELYGLHPADIAGIGM